MSFRQAIEPGAVMPFVGFGDVLVFGTVLHPPVASSFHILELSSEALKQAVVVAHLPVVIGPTVLKVTLRGITADHVEILKVRET